MVVVPPLPVKIPYLPLSRNAKNATVPAALRDGDSEPKSLNAPAESAIRVKVYSASALAAVAVKSRHTMKKAPLRGSLVTFMQRMLSKGQIALRCRVVRRARLSPSESARSSAGEGSGTGLAMAMPVVPLAS